MPKKKKISTIIKGDLLELTDAYPFRIAFMSDFHIGAEHGIFPKGYKDPYGREINLNGGQKILWNYLQEFIEVMKKYKINTLILLGDLIAGKNRKEGGVYIMNVDEEIQKDACAYLIAYICEQIPSIQRVLMFRGTPYHGSRDTAIEESITGILAKYGVNAEYLGEYSYLTLQYGAHKKVLWIAHPATGATVYPETVLGRDIGQFLQAYGMGKIPKVDMIIRAHRHEYMELHKSAIRYIILPCWQFYVPYDKAVKWYAKWQPDIGGVILLADEKCRLRPWHFIYPNIVNPQRFLTLRHERALGLNKKKLV